MFAKTKLYLHRLNQRIKVGSEKGLYRVSGLIASACRRTIRVRKRPSRPGTPPHAHTRGGLRVIRFSVRGMQSLIGPLKFSNSLSEPVPHVHEFGKRAYRRNVGWQNFPKRAYMSVALLRLQRQGKIPKSFSVEVRKLL